MLTLAEENYIKEIYHLSKNGKTAVSTNAIAETLNTKPASVSDMIKRLSSKSLLNYQKYKGVTLTDEGTTLALKVIRKHRLWEVFLVDKLNFNWDEVHDIAEQLEHIKSPILTDKLDEFLGFPKTDPHGDPIPDANGVIPEYKKTVLHQLETGTKGHVMGVKDSSGDFLKHLNKLSIGLGTEIEIIDRITFDQSLEIKADDTQRIISREVAQNIYVSTY